MQPYMHVLVSSRFLQQNLEEYLQQKVDSGTKHVNISCRLDSWCQVFTAIKHEKCSFLGYDTIAAIILPWMFYVYELWCFTLYNWWSRLWNFMLLQPCRWGFKSSGRGHGTVRQVVPDVANSVFVFRLQQMILKITHCELSQCQEPLTQL